MLSAHTDRLNFSDIIAIFLRTINDDLVKVDKALFSGGPCKKLRRQGARILRSEAYFVVRCNDEG
jgi:hypothetical protein